MLMNKNNHTTSTKCQYQIADSNPKILIVSSGFDISSKLYNKEKDGEAKLNKIRAGIDVHIISIKFE